MNNITRHLAKATIKAVMVTSGLALGFSLAPDTPMKALPSPEVQVAPSAAEVLLETHSDICWTSEEKALAFLPGSALVDIKGKVFKTSRPAQVDDAFNQVLGEENHPNLKVIALCI